MLDTERLEAVHERLQTLLARGTTVMPTPEIMARHRVLASVLEASRRNLTVLERLSAAGEPLEARPTWDR